VLRRTGLVLRSRLYVPGTKVAWVDKAVAAGVDAVIIDLDDAVAAGDKDQARADVAALIARGAPVPIFVRVNDLTSSWALDDLEAVVQTGLFGIVVPRVTEVSQIVTLDSLLTWLERRAKMDEGTVWLSPIFETALSLHLAYDIARASPRVDYVGGIATNGGDVQREIGYRWSPATWETTALRSQCLVALRAAGVAHPITGIWTALDDAQGLASFAQQGRDLGYEGMDTIHPTHIGIVNEIYGIDKASIERARRIVKLAQVDESTGEIDERTIGAVRFEGQMIDAAMVRTALELIQRLGGAEEPEGALDTST
jgi:citrate lyase subunit beta/citryl-CoA lyase